MNVVEKFGNFPINSIILQQDNYFFGEMVVLRKKRTVRGGGSTPSPSPHIKYFNKKRNGHNTISASETFFCIIFFNLFISSCINSNCFLISACCLFNSCI